jgi:predicted secreted Zn-dependent protease
MCAAPACGEILAIIHRPEAEMQTRNPNTHRKCRNIEVRAESVSDAQMARGKRAKMEYDTMARIGR